MPVLTRASLESAALFQNMKLQAGRFNMWQLGKQH